MKTETHLLNPPPPPPRASTGLRAQPSASLLSRLPGLARCTLSTQSCNLAPSPPPQSLRLCLEGCPSILTDVPSLINLAILPPTTLCLTPEFFLVRRQEPCNFSCNRTSVGSHTLLPSYPTPHGHLKDQFQEFPSACCPLPSPSPSPPKI